MASLQTPRIQILSFITLMAYALPAAGLFHPDPSRLASTPAPRAIYDAFFESLFRLRSPPSLPLLRLLVQISIPVANRKLMKLMEAIQRTRDRGCFSVSLAPLPAFLSAVLRCGGEGRGLTLRRTRGYGIAPLSSIAASLASYSAISEMDRGLRREEGTGVSGIHSRHVR